MSVVERVAEGLARRTNRRQALKRTAAAVFGLVAAWAVEGIGMPGALASHCRYTSQDTQCHYPGGIDCRSLRDGSGNCDGERCANKCRIERSWYAETGCWCTQPDGTGGYYVCCDCKCRGVRCGCSRWVSSGSH